MPKQGKKPQYDSALGSIYDFIFAESKKTPNKVKPVKITGVDGTSEITDALVAVLENPLVFVNKSTLDAFEDVINFDLLSYRYGGGERDTVKLNLKDLKKAFSDPNGFLDKSFAKYEANRKINKAQWAGDAIQGVLAGTWARKHGLDIETVKAVSEIHRASDRFSQTANFDPTKVTSLGERNGALIDKYLNNSDPKYTLAFFIQQYGDEKVATKKFNQYKKLVEQVNSGKRNELVYDKNVYSFLEGLDITNKAIKSEQAGDKLQAENYRHAARYLESSVSDAERKANERRNKLEIQKYQAEINRLKESNDPDKKEKIKVLERNMKLISTDTNMSRMMGLAGTYGKVQGFTGSMSTLNNYFLKGNLAGSLITGEFFDPNRNRSWINPTDAGRRKTLAEAGVKGFSKYNTHGVSINFKISKPSNSRYAQEYYDNMIKVYYYSPVVMAKSLMNGELFARKAYENMNKFNNRYGQKIPGFDMAKLFDKNGNVDDSYLSQILGVSTADQAEALSKFLKSNKRWGNLAYGFSAIKRVQDKVSSFVENKIGRKLRQKVATELLKRKAFQKFSKEILNEWVLKGGVKVLGKAIGTALTGVIGPAGQIVGDIIAQIAMDVAQKVAKPVIKFSMHALLYGIVGLLGIIFLLVNKSHSVLSVHSNVAPSQVIECAGSGNTSGADDSDKTDSSGDDYDSDDTNKEESQITGTGPSVPFDGKPLPPGETCLISSPSARCSQGMYGSFSHKNTPAIDIATGGYFYAPTFCGNNNCVVTYYNATATCGDGYAGGLIKFTATYEGNVYEFKLLHIDSPYRPGDKIGSGEPVARIMTLQETGDACSTGQHLHMETRFNGAIVDPREVLNNPSSEGGFGCNISSCV